MDVLHIPAVALFTGMISSFAVALICASISEAMLR